MGATRYLAQALLAVLAVTSLVTAGRPFGSPESPTVTTANGEVRGRRIDAERGAAQFVAYRGIPFAEPPVGELRFRGPRPAAPWRGTLDATEDPPRCPQINNQELSGQEDCLYLNVYVPEKCGVASLLPRQPLPVLVLVHGGAFEIGSGRMDFLGPHFLLNDDVVIASINFRQGPLGYLSLDTEQVPGNAGLKDLALALTWLQENLRAFGGDPGRVTALGYSTGASAVHLLSLYPQTRDLFSRAVLLSGHAITARAYTERHVERAQSLAAILGAPDNNTDTVTNTLRQASVQDLLRANSDPRSLGQPLPSPERRAAGTEARLITQDPESLLRQPRARPMPILLGVDEREGSWPYTKWGLGSQSPEVVDEQLPSFMPADLLPGADTAAMLGLGAAPGAAQGPGPLNTDAALRLAQLVRDEYSGGGPIANNITVLLDFLGDIYTYASTARAVDFIANSSTDAAPLYLYEFKVDDAYNYVKKNRNISFPGASHTDDLGYLVRSDLTPNLNQDLRRPGVAPRTLQFMTRLVTDFAKGVVPESWPAVSAAAGSSRPVLYVGPGLRRRVVHPDSDQHHNAFWTSVYRDLRSRNSSIGRKIN